MSHSRRCRRQVDVRRWRPGERGAEAQPNKGDPVRVDIAPGHEVVDDWADDVLPVGPKYQALLEQCGALPGPVEGENVIAAFQGGGAGQEVELLGGTVVATGEDHRRSRPVGDGAGEEVARQGCGLVRDGHDLGRRRQ